MEIYHKEDDDRCAWRHIMQMLRNACRHYLAERPGKLNVLWNTLRPMSPEHWALYMLDRERVNLCIEVPVIGRPAWSFEGEHKTNYWRLAFDDPSSLYGGFRIPPRASPARFLEIIDRSGMELKRARPHPTGCVLYITQVPGDTGGKGVDTYDAAIFDLYELRRRTTRPIVVSVHPDIYSWARYAQEWPSWVRLQRFCQMAGIKITTEGERAHHYYDDTFVVITHTSGIAVETLLQGLRTVTMHRGSFCYPICPHDLEEVDDLPAINEGERLEWFSRLAYCQWTTEEINNGTALAHLFEL